MPEKRVTVWVQQFQDRKNLMLQWIDPETGKRQTRTARTADPAEAEAARADLEYELNHGLEPGRPRVFTERRDDPREKKLKPTHGYVIEGDNGHYKIGKSYDPMARLLDLTVASQHELTLVHQIQTDHMRTLERLLHEKFKAQQVRGEWFKLSARDVFLLCQVDVWNARRGGCRTVPLEHEFYQAADAGPADAPLN
jgi:hypothetical protein